MFMILKSSLKIEFMHIHDIQYIEIHIIENQITARSLFIYIQLRQEPAQVCEYKNYVQ